MFHPVSPSVNIFRCLCLSAAFSFAIAANSQSISINEILASNASLDYDDFFEYDDWIELYNDGGILDLAGHYLTDDADSLTKWMFPLDDPGLTTILPNSHVRLWCDKDEQQGSDHTNFKLSGEGETIYFIDPDGMTILDSVAYGIQQDNISFGAECDGCDEWQFFNIPTPDAPNVESLVAPSLLYINEYQSNNVSSIFDEFDEADAWVEVFNPNQFQVNLSGYTIELNGASHTFENNEPWLTTIPADGFQIFWFDGQIDQGSNHLSFAPGASGDIQLIGNDGISVDEAEWNANLPIDESLGREQDGAPTWVSFASPTPRVTNTLQIIAPGTLVINEVQSDNFITYADSNGEYDDWIEIYNYGNTPVDITNYYLSDRPDQPQKWVVPFCACDSTIIQPNTFIVIFADEDGSQGWNHANFKISSNGETIALRSPDGFTLADEIDVPAMGLGKSWGRETDAGTPWVEFFLPTPSASNGAPNAVDNAFMHPDALPYPNPVISGGLLNVSSSGTIYNLAGKEMANWNGPGNVVVSFPSGVYSIRYLNEDGLPKRPVKILVID